jgi:hypothetical protein
MRIIYLFIALVTASCAALKPQPKPAPQPQHHADTPPTVCEILVSAVNRGDWAVLQSWAKPGTSAATAVQTWQNAAKAGNPVKVGKFLNAQTVGGTSKKPLRLYSFSLENKDGTVNPHWLQIKVREADGEAEVLDFWIFGW